MNGRAWTGKEMWLLLTFSEKMSQAEAARRLGRTKSAVTTKVRATGIAWRRGFISLTSIARGMPCSLGTAREGARQICHRRIGRSNGRRYLLTHEQADWLHNYLTKRLERNSQQREAGRLAAETKKQRRALTSGCAVAAPGGPAPIHIRAFLASQFIL